MAAKYKVSFLHFFQKYVYLFRKVDLSSHLFFILCCCRRNACSAFFLKPFFLSNLLSVSLEAQTTSWFTGTMLLSTLSSVWIHLRVSLASWTWFRSAAVFEGDSLRVIYVSLKENIKPLKILPWKGFITTDLNLCYTICLLLVRFWKHNLLLDHDLIPRCLWIKTKNDLIRIFTEQKTNPAKYTQNENTNVSE